MNIRDRLIDDLANAHKFWSLRLAALGVVLQGLLEAIPDAVLHGWALLPPELKIYVPPGVLKVIPLAIMASAVVARLIKQPKLENAN